MFYWRLTDRYLRVAAGEPSREALTALKSSNRAAMRPSPPGQESSAIRHGQRNDRLELNHAVPARSRE
jgi:hypothetical protein